MGWEDKRNGRDSGPSLTCSDYRAGEKRRWGHKGQDGVRGRGNQGWNSGVHTGKDVLVGRMNPGAEEKYSTRPPQFTGKKKKGTA